MNKMKQTLLIVVIVAMAGVVGFLLGSDAKHKWVSKLKNLYDDRKQLAADRSIVRKGGVLLDDIELEAFHN